MMEKFGEYKAVDKELWEMMKALPYLSLLSPSNIAEEKIKFFLHIEKKQKYNPQFIYELQGINLARLSLKHRKLKKMFSLIHKRNKLLDLIFHKSIDSVSNRINLLKHTYNPNSMLFTQYSVRLYGKPTVSEVNFSGKQLSTTVSDNKEWEAETASNPRLSSEEISKLASERLQKFGIVDWDIELKEGFASQFLVITSQKRMIIDKHFSLGVKDVDTLLNHEINAHVLRTENASLQPFLILKDGLGENEITDEGVALYIESKLATKERFRRRITRYAGMTLATHYSLSMDFYDTYHKLLRFFDKEAAWYYTLRVRRGITDTSQPGAFTKDACYIKGFKKVQNFLRKEPKMFEDLFSTRLPVEFAPCVRELKNAGLLVPLRYNPFL